MPIALILGRARHAKSSMERHNVACWAWEASVKLAVAARPPADARGLALATLGRWVAAVEWGSARLPSSLLAAAHEQFTCLRTDGPDRLAAVTARRLLHALPGYRNEVIGHAPPREADFYDPAAPKLIDALEEAWGAGVFWPSGARLAWVESASESRWLDPPSEGTRDLSLPDDVESNRLYLVDRGGAHPLHPFVLAVPGDGAPRFFFFNGLKRAARYLDVVSGESRRADELAERFPSLEDDVRAVFGDAQGGRARPAEDPELFGECRRLERIGEGAMGEVFVAVQESMDRRVALKVLRSSLAGDAAAQRRFLRETDALARCEHQNVVRVLTRGEAHGRPYFAMEYVDGLDLGQLAKRLGDAPDLAAAVRAPRGGAGEGRPGPDLVDELCGLLRGAALGLQHLHDEGIVHRDVKPSNIMVTRRNPRAVIMDLGLARVDGATLSSSQHAGALVGTLHYIAPELIDGGSEPSAATDVYSLGATFYELFCGERMFGSVGATELLAQALSAPVRPADAVNPAVGPGLARLLARATARDPAQRYRQCSELVRDLDALAAGELLEPPASAAPARSRSRPAAAGAAALVAIAALYFGVFQSAASDVPSATITIDAELPYEAWYVPIDRRSFEVGDAWPIGAGPIEGVSVPAGECRIVVLGERGAFDELHRVLTPGEYTLRSTFRRTGVVGMRRVGAPGTVVHGEAGVDHFEHPKLQTSLVNVPAFWIDEAEVSNREYLPFVEAGLGAPPREWAQAGWRRGAPMPAAIAELPVVGVPWVDARAYAEWCDKRLPTWFEWNVAMRGEEGRLFPWGNEYDEARLVGVGGDADYGKGALPVRSGEPEGPHGLYHSYGNAREWTATGAIDPETGEPRSGEQMLMGYPWSTAPDPRLTLAGTSFPPLDQDDRPGFRCVRSADPLRSAAASVQSR